MALSPGTRLGPYEITAQIGVGGMGEVYRATDTKLKRQVAIKVLPDAVAQDAERLARFQREAEVLAALNHPGIAQIHGLEDSDGSKALVMELVEGPTLADRIAQGAIPVDEALPIAKQIAEALEAAHEQGIIHRDLKPANIKLRPDGMVKVLDFGLAKAMEPTVGASSSMSMSPTITTPAMTQAGLILGTAAYMAPEQARGKPVDKRADIWAYGCVLYEMLTGRCAFGGDDVTVTLARIVEREAPLGLLPSKTPAAVRSVIALCLDKDPRQRIQAAGDVRLALDGAFSVLQDEAATPASTGARLPWAVAAVSLLGAAALALPVARDLAGGPVLALPEMRLDVVTPGGGDPVSFALSPDGRQLVFVAPVEGTPRLWLRPLEESTASPLASTDGASLPFWSPDGRSVAFFAGGELVRLDLDGGTRRPITEVGFARGGAWSGDGVIIFAPDPVSPLLRVSATGGDVMPVTTLLEGQTSHRNPAFIADGRRFLFYAQGAPEVSGIYLATVDTSDVTRVTGADSSSVLLPSGWLLWVQGETLTAQALDVDEGRLVGDPVALVDGVEVDATAAAPALSVSATGLIGYRVRGAGVGRRLTWFDRTGTAIGTFGAVDEGSLRDPSLSPDGDRVVAARTEQGNEDLWLLDGTRAARFTFDAGIDRLPVWSADGQRIAFTSNRTGPYNVYVKDVSGAGIEELVVGSPQLAVPTDWSTDGRSLLYFSVDPVTGEDLRLWTSENGGQVSTLLRTEFAESRSRFSPDGRWLAYSSDETGRHEVYMRAVAPEGGQWQVSAGGGTYPVWARDGREVFYLAPNGDLMAAPITFSGDTPNPGAPASLFPTQIVGGGTDRGQGRQYDVSADGRFLINTLLGPPASAPITLIQNWTTPRSP